MEDWIIGGMLGPVPAAFGLAGLMAVLVVVGLGFTVRRTAGGSGGARQKQRVG